MQSITKYNETFHFTFCYNVKLMCWCMSNITLWAKVSSRGDSTYMNQNPSECMYTNIFVFWGEKIKRTEFDQFHKFPFESRKRFFFNKNKRTSVINDLILSSDNFSVYTYFVLQYWKGHLPLSELRLANKPFCDQDAHFIFIHRLLMYILLVYYVQDFQFFLL